MSLFLEQVKLLPRLGFGIGLKDEFTADLLSHVQQMDWAEQVDWLEVIPENYMNKGGRSLQGLQALVEEGFAFASHGVNLSIGSTDAVNEDYLFYLNNLFEQIQPAWFSDHLCFSSVNGHYANDLLPLPFNEESIAHCIHKIKCIQKEFSIPFLVENISYYAAFSSDGITEATWLKTIVEEADCGLLLDVNNVFVNAQNHGYNPREFIQQLPLERVVEIHIAGHLETADMIIDTHGEPIRPEVFELFSELYPQCINLKGVLLERDSNLPPFSELMQELQAVRHASMQGVLL